MSVAPSLSESLAAAGDKFDANQSANTEGSAQDISQSLGGQDPLGGQSVTPPEGEATKVEDEDVSFLNLAPGEKKSEVGDPPAGDDPPPVKMELKIPGETIVGEVDGKPVTAAQAAENHLLRSDYTKKTQEFSDFKRNAEPAVQFIHENAHYLKPLGDGAALIEQGDLEGGRQLALGALQALAKEYGLDIVAAGSERTRAPNGQFAKSQGEPQLDLEKIKEEFGEDSPAYINAVNNEALRKELNEFKAGQEQQKTAATQAQQAAQMQNEVQQVAKLWTDKGVKGIDANKAMSLVGRPMTPEMALQVTHLAQVVEFMLSKKSNRPNEPGGTKAPPTSMEGKGLSDAIRDRAAHLS